MLLVARFLDCCWWAEWTPYRQSVCRQRMITTHEASLWRSAAHWHARGVSCPYNKPTPHPGCHFIRPSLVLSRSSPFHSILSFATTRFSYTIFVTLSIASCFQQFFFFIYCFIYSFVKIALLSIGTFSAMKMQSSKTRLIFEILIFYRWGH